MRLFLTICFLCLASVAQCQLVINGKVVDSVSKTPVAAAIVYINETSIRTATDDQGKFHLESDYSGKIDLVVSHISFERKVIPLNGGPLPLQLTITVEPNSNQLKEVTVTGDPMKAWRK